MPEEKIRVLIVGAGKIAAGYDHPTSEEILTHAHGFLSIAEFELAGFVDANFAKAELAAEKWGGKAFSSIAAAFADGGIDVVSVATPDETHATVLKQLANYSPQLIFCEKPLALSIGELDELVRLYTGRSTQILVNYLRRFLPAFQTIRREFAEGRYGRFLTGSGYYVKGFLHNGSHMVDLIRYLAGDIIAVEKWTDDSTGPDLDFDASARLRLKQGGSFFILPLPGNPYWLFEMDLLFEKKRLRVLDSGSSVQEYELRANPLFPETEDMIEFVLHPTELGQAMQYAAQHIRDYLQGKVPLLCPLDEAAATLRACLGRP